ncbi:MAG: hypothetical protein JWO33_1591 [Caulobacteraceae bacterium]|nr:hypothetical protein [Caulobacteraceae bacterium]
MNAVIPIESARPARPREGFKRIWLPLPLSVLWVLLAPFAIVLSLFAGLAPPRYRINGPLAAVQIGVALFALSGTRIEIRNARVNVFILII